MCGIVGHIGPKNSIEVVLEGLKRLEYRGYDSAGVSFKKDGRIEVYKKAGKIENLKGVLARVETNANSCIGHTRWATHGEVNDTNSHPHTSENIAIVHNGIIENAHELKKELIQKGVKFKSQTDSEVYMALVNLEIEKGQDLFTAITESFKKVTGNSAFVILNKNTNEILALKRAAPLVCGTSNKTREVLVSSDPYALAGMVDTIYFPEDGVVCRLDQNSSPLISFFEMDGSPSNRFKVKPLEIDITTTTKGAYPHFMLKEIYEQPGLIRNLIQHYLKGAGKEHLLSASETTPSHIHIAACGTASYAGFVIKEFIERINRIAVSNELASEFRYRDPILKKNEIGLFISQSGETADTLAAQELCQENNLKTISVVNVEGSTLFRNCTVNLQIKAGVEIGVASTKAFTQQALTGRLLAAAIKGDLKSEKSVKNLFNKFSLLAERIDELLLRSDEIKAIAEKVSEQKGFFFTGRGMYYPIALEGALKLKEIAYVHAEGYAAGELKHGPIALIDEEMVNIALVGPELIEKTISNVQEIKARKGKIVIFGPENNSDIASISDHYLGLKFDGLEELSPLYINVANQLFAYWVARCKGTDIDKPKNLAKSVTVE